MCDTPPSPGARLTDVPPRPFVLIICAGPVWDGDAGAASRQTGIPVLLVDPLRGGTAHDISLAGVRQELRGLCSRPIDGGSACVLAAHFATPCRSFSPLNRWRGLRTIDDPEGSAAPAEYADNIATEIAIIEAAVALAE
ncbi:MAG: hypothetical protein SGPRY_002874 [Prymnesium sp.]